MCRTCALIFTQVHHAPLSCERGVMRDCSLKYSYNVIISVIASQHLSITMTRTRSCTHGCHHTHMATTAAGSEVDKVGSWLHQKSGMLMLRGKLTAHTYHSCQPRWTSLPASCCWLLWKYCSQQGYTGRHDDIHREVVGKEDNVNSKHGGCVGGQGEAMQC